MAKDPRERVERELFGPVVALRVAVVTAAWFGQFWYGLGLMQRK